MAIKTTTKVKMNSSFNFKEALRKLPTFLTIKFFDFTYKSLDILKILRGKKSIEATQNKNIIRFGAGTNRKRKLIQTASAHRKVRLETSFTYFQKTIR